MSTIYMSKPRPKPIRLIRLTTSDEKYEFTLIDGTIKPGYYSNTVFTDITTPINTITHTRTNYYKHIFVSDNGSFACSNYTIDNGIKHAAPFSCFPGVLLDAAPLEITSYTGPPVLQPALQAPAQAPAQTPSLQSPVQSALAAALSPERASPGPRNVVESFEKLKEIGPEAIRADFAFCCDHFRDFKKPNGDCKFQVTDVKLVDLNPDRVDAFCRYWGEDRQNEVALVYHGSTNRGRTAIIASGHVNPGLGLFGPGVYFGTDPLTAMRYNTDGDLREKGQVSSVLLVCAVLSKSFNHTHPTRPLNYVITNAEPGSALPMFLVYYDTPSDLFNYGNSTDWEKAGVEPAVGRSGTSLYNRRESASHKFTTGLGGRRTRRARRRTKHRR